MVEREIVEMENESGGISGGLMTRGRAMGVGIGRISQYCCVCGVVDVAVSVFEGRREHDYSKRRYRFDNYIFTTKY
jgi:hypothetical protein